jgi:hypothetical protein
MLLWGGGTSAGPYADGAAYDPATDQWRALPAAPLAPRENALAVWTGDELLVAGGYGAGGDLVDAAAYDPAAGRWRSLPAPPFERTGLIQLVWSGDYAIAWAAPRIEGGATAARYDRRTDTWAVFDPPPDIAWFTPVLVPVGRLVFAWGSVGGIPGPSAAFLLDPEALTWTPVDGPPLRWGPGTGLAIRGHSVLLYTGDSFRPGAVWTGGLHHWRALPALPRPAAGATVTWTTDRLIVWGGTDAAGAPTSDGNAWSV